MIDLKPVSIYRSFFCCFQVGTRPPTVNEVKDYELHHHKRTSITPGITGNWQVSADMLPT